MKPRVIPSAHVPGLWRREDVPDMAPVGGICIVAGSAANVAEEIAEARRWSGADAPIWGASGGACADPAVVHVVCRDRGYGGFVALARILQRAVDAAGTNRAWRYHSVIARDPQKKRLLDHFAGGSMSESYDTKDWQRVEYWWELDHSPGGTSLMSAVFAALRLHDRVIVAGAPQNGEGGHAVFRRDEWDVKAYFGGGTPQSVEFCESRRRAWKEVAPLLFGRVTAVSGLLHELFGPPRPASLVRVA